MFCENCICPQPLLSDFIDAWFEEMKYVHVLIVFRRFKPPKKSSSYYFRCMLQNFHYQRSLKT